MSIVYNELLSRAEYGFIHNNENLRENLIYLTLSGSVGYGTNLQYSDIDLRGIAIERKEGIYGFQSFEQFEDEDTDTVIYGLKKFVSLALKGNPNILELLGTKDEHILYMNKFGKRLRENKDLFLSKRIVYTFGNYAAAQLRRLENALARDHYPQGKKEKHILSSISNQMEHFKSNYSTFPEGSIKLAIDKSNKSEFEEEIYMDINLKHYPLRDFISIYSEMSNIIREYDKLNHRNRKKDESKLLKHAMHLIRLLIMGTEILNTHQINTYRSEEQELLMNIRKGSYTYEEIFMMVEKYESAFRSAATNTTLPDMPNEKEAEKLLVSLYENFYTKNQ